MDILILTEDKFPYNIMGLVDFKIYRQDGAVQSGGTRPPDCTVPSYHSQGISIADYWGIQAAACRDMSNNHNTAL